MNGYDLAIIGAGPAGVAAAVTSARRGLKVTLLDESPQLGGQVLANADQEGSDSKGPEAIRRGAQMLNELKDLRVEIHRQAVVWGIDGTRLAFSSPGGTTQIEASALIIATGAREFVPPFPGWTLPGVMTLGGAQHLIERYSVLPAKSLLLAGTGPLLWALAATVLENDGDLVAIVDFSQPAKWLPAIGQLKAVSDRLALGWRYLKSIRQNRVPYLFSRAQMKAHGNDVLRSVSVGRRDFHADGLCVGFGFRPNIELFQLAGCALHFDRLLGGWIPRTEQDLQTTRSRVFAAGECAGIGGAEKALLEGELAALSVASALDIRMNPEDRERQAWLRKQRANEIRFGRILNQVCEPPASFFSDLDGDLVVCRCENVRAGEINRTANHGTRTLDGLKNELRVGQGMCQGRTCGPILQRILAEELDQPLEQLQPFHARPPVKPIRIEQFQR